MEFRPNHLLVNIEAAMATAKAQRRWRKRKRYVKSKLNLMAGRLVHNDLAEIAKSISLREKGEAVGFAFYIAKGPIQHSTHFGSEKVA